MDKKNHRKYRRAQSGQAIVLMALLMIVLLGFVALAIDGGRMFVMRRDAQNAADAASVAAAGAYCLGQGDPTAKALQLAKLNGYDDAKKPTQTVTVTKRDFPGGADFIVVTYSEQPAAFAGNIGIPVLVASAEGISRCVKTRYMPELAGIVATANAQQCTNALQVSGSNAVISSAFTNGEAQMSNSSGTYESIFYGSQVSASPGVTITTPPEKLQYPIALIYPDIEQYAPGGAKALAAGSDYHYYSGNYNGGSNVEGLIFAERDIRINNVRVGPKGVTFVSRSGNIHLSATDTTLSPFVDGVLVLSYAEPQNCGVPDVSISSRNVTWTGTMWAKGNLWFADMGNSTENGGLFAYTIRLSASDTQILRNPGVQLKIPPTWFLSQ